MVARLDQINRLLQEHPSQNPLVRFQSSVLLEINDNSCSSLLPVDRAFPREIKRSRPKSVGRILFGRTDDRTDQIFGASAAKLLAMLAQSGRRH